MYKLKFTPTFEGDFKKLDRHIAKNILAKIYWLSENLKQTKIENVAFVPRGLKGLKKYRIGDWRIFFWLDNKDKMIILYGIEHRKSAYKNF